MVIMIQVNIVVRNCKKASNCEAEEILNLAYATSS